MSSKNPRSPICTYEELCKSFGNAFDRAELYRSPSGAVIYNPEYQWLKTEIAYCARSHLAELQRNLGQEGIVQEALSARGAREKRLGELRSELESFAEANADGQTLSWMKGELAVRVTRGEVLPSLETLEIEAKERGMKPISRASKSRLEELIGLQIRLAEPVKSTGLLDADLEVGSDDLRYFAPGSEYFFEGYPHLKEKVARAKQDSLTHERQISSLVDSLKKALIAKLRSYASPFNQKAIESLIQRIEATSVDFKAARQQNCDWPNAFNSRGKVLICQSLQDYPESVLTYLLGHEMGHSIGPCSVQPLIQGLPFDALPYTQYPLSEQASCLLGPESTAARAGDIEAEYRARAESQKKFTTQNYERMAQGPLNEARRQEMVEKLQDLLHRIRNNVDGIGPCLAVKTKSGFLRPQLEETMADWVGVELFAESLRNLAEVDQVERFREVSIHFAAKECPYPAQGTLAQIRNKLAEIGCRSSPIRIPRNDQEDDHLSATVRFEKVLLAHPVIRKAASCSELKGPVYCE
ncbi:MAG: hypothetical protein NDJ90_04570 [Oligoflexia bacterium]|nr:hypothetical protein [Oligoflexia bacterium]